MGLNTKSQVVANLAPSPVIEMNWVGDTSLVDCPNLIKSNALSLVKSWKAAPV